MRSAMWRRAWANRSGLLFLAVGMVAATAAMAEAAQLSVDAPESCLDPSTLAEEVGDLIGKPLGSVADVDFRIRISETPKRRWRLRLEMVDHRSDGDGPPAIRGSREIEGATCAELAEAASVAIAGAVRSISPETAAAEPGRPATPEAMPPSPASLARAARPTPTPGWHPAVALALATDTGALPKTGLGVDLEGDFQRGSLRLIALATWFGSRDTIGAGDVGGTFQLALGGMLACYAPRWGRWTPLACGGIELGRLAGTGTGTGVARPETGDALWRAGRADLGVTAALAANTALVLRAGMAVPLSHPAFVLDESELVYRPGELAGRLTVGLELEF
jgi:hypothetical protein